MTKGDSFYESIGLRIREVRKRKHVSQEDLGAELELDQRAISEMENGIRRIQINELIALADILKTPYEFFLQDVIPSETLVNQIREEISQLSTPELHEVALDILRTLNKRLS